MTGTTNAAVPARGKGMLITGAVLLLLGIVAIIVSIVMTAGAATSLVSRISAPQIAPTTFTSQLDGGSTYAVYESVPGAGSVTVVQAGDIAVTGPAGPVTVTKTNGTATTVGNGNMSFAEVATFTPPASGSYTIEVATQGAAVAVAPAVSTAAKGFAWLAAIIPGILFAFVGFILLIVGAVQRSSSRKQQQPVANPTV